MKRKVLSMVLAASMALSVCACGSNGESASSDTSTTEAKAEETEETETDNLDATATEGDSYTINVASSFAAEGPMQEIMEGFKANIESETGGRIQVVLHPSGALGSVKEIAEG